MTNDTAPSSTKPEAPTVTLSTPVTIDGTEVSKITLRKPGTGELRGLKLTDILQMDVSTMIRLLPRITMPPLSEAQVSSLPPEDFTDFAGKTVVFFARKEQLEMAQG